eukprot:GHVL01033415.1.p1 GENE.GHVL01033415.1~~GHVL01033415.1.p1  ORF type:complete len:831 (+),score=163.56 GHVL01033415.1:395-2887(+)
MRDRLNEAEKKLAQLQEEKDKRQEEVDAIVESCRDIRCRIGDDTEEDEILSKATVSNSCVQKLRTTRDLLQSIESARNRWIEEAAAAMTVLQLAVKPTLFESVEDDPDAMLLDSFDDALIERHRLYCNSTHACVKKVFRCIHPDHDATSPSAVTRNDLRQGFLLHIQELISVYIKKFFKRQEEANKISDSIWSLWVEINEINDIFEGLSKEAKKQLYEQFPEFIAMNLCATSEPSGCHLNHVQLVLRAMKNETFEVSSLRASMERARDFVAARSATVGSKASQNAKIVNLKSVDWAAIWKVVQQVEDGQNERSVGIRMDWLTDEYSRMLIKRKDKIKDLVCRRRFDIVKSMVVEMRLSPSSVKTSTHPLFCPEVNRRTLLAPPENASEDDLALHMNIYQEIQIEKEQVKAVAKAVMKLEGLLELRREYQTSISDPDRLGVKKKPGEKPSKGGGFNPGRLLREEKLNKQITREMPVKIKNLKSKLERWESANKIPLRFLLPNELMKSGGLKMGEQLQDVLVSYMEAAQCMAAANHQPDDSALDCTLWQDSCVDALLAHAEDMTKPVPPVIVDASFMVILDDESKAQVMTDKIDRRAAAATSMQTLSSCGSSLSHPTSAPTGNQLGNVGSHSGSLGHPTGVVSDQAHDTRSSGRLGNQAQKLSRPQSSRPPPLHPSAVPSRDVTRRSDVRRLSEVRCEPRNTEDQQPKSSHLPRQAWSNDSSADKDTDFVGGGLVSLKDQRRMWKEKRISIRGNEDDDGEDDARKDDGLRGGSRRSVVSGYDKNNFDGSALSVPSIFEKIMFFNQICLYFMQFLIINPVSDGWNPDLSFLTI